MRRDALTDDLADTGGIDKESVHPAARDHLGIPADDFRSGFRELRCHTFYDAFQFVKGQALFDHERRTEIERFRPHHRKVVHRTRDGKLADIAPTEKEGADRKTVGRKRDLSAHLQHPRSFVLGGVQLVG